MMLHAICTGSDLQAVGDLGLVGFGQQVEGDPSDVLEISILPARLRASFQAVWQRL